MVLAAGHFAAKDEFIHRPFTMHAVGFIVAGRGSYQMGTGPVHAIEPGCMFTVWPGPKQFNYGALWGGVWEEYYFCVRGSGLERLTRSGLFPKDGRVYPLSDPVPIMALYRELIGAARGENPGDADRAALIAERLLLEMYYSRASTRAALSAGKSIEAVLQYCRQHLAEEIDFAALARQNAMSYSSLRQKIRQLTGAGPAQYVTALRCDAARKLLSATDLGVKQIAARVGIDDPYAFSRVFKRHVGLSPQHYREQASPWA
jgi:AraC family transcriptional regulator of arabinose operon